MDWRTRLPLMFVMGSLLGGAGCGGDEDSSDKAPPAQAQSEAQAPTQRGVATIRAELAPLCIERLRAGGEGPASPAIEGLVDEMVAAYEAGPKNEATNGIIENVTTTMQDGCGTDQVAKLEGALEEAGVAPSAEDEVDIPADECEEKRISGESIPRQEREEGTCTDAEGIRVKVVDKGTKLTLKQLDASFGGYRTAETLSASTGTEKASGVYAILTLTVTNKLDSPVSFDSEQVVLSLGDKSYTPDFDAGNMPGDSFVWNDEEIQPGNSQTGTVIFDVPNKQVGKFATSGNIVIFQFSDADVSSPEEAESTLGFIRTYK